LRGSAPARPRREALVIAAAAVAAAVITLVVMTVSYNAREHRVLPQGAAGAQSEPSQELSAQDLLLPLPPPAGQPPDYYPFRPRLLRWSRENVDRFWVPPRRIAADAISAANDRNMESLFEKVK
jgi:hypothetical protein